MNLWFIYRIKQFHDYCGFTHTSTGTSIASSECGDDLYLDLDGDTEVDLFGDLASSVLNIIQDIQETGTGNQNTVCFIIAIKTYYSVWKCYKNKTDKQVSCSSTCCRIDFLTRLNKDDILKFKCETLLNSYWKLTEKFHFSIQIFRRPS